MARLIIKFWRLYVGRLKLTKNVDYKSRVFQVRVSMDELPRRNFHRQSEDGWPVVPYKSRISINAQYIWCFCFPLNFVAFFTLRSFKACDILILKHITSKRRTKYIHIGVNADQCVGVSHFGTDHIGVFSKVRYSLVFLFNFTTYLFNS